MGRMNKMKQIKAAVSKMSPHGEKKSNKKDGPLASDEDNAPGWNTGQEFQFYVPWLWKDSPEPPPDKLHPKRQVVRIARPKKLPGFTEEFHEAYIRHCVSCAVKDLVYDMQFHLTCTEDQVKLWNLPQIKAWERFNIVQNTCDLPEVTIPGFDGVLPIEMTMAIKQVSIHREQASNLSWVKLPSPGQCIERVKNHVLIHVTPACSIHVHIKPENALLFDMQAFKKLASILWLAEERLDKLYQPARNTSENPSHHSIRHSSNLALEEDLLVTGSLGDLANFLGIVDLSGAEMEKLSMIWKASDRYELRELLRVHPSVGKHGYLAYNFFNLFLTSQKATIEFRKIESTTDARIIDAWIECFLLLTDFSANCSMKTFQNMIERLGKPQIIYNTREFLRDIGCKNAAIGVLKQKYIQQSPPEEPSPAPSNARPRRRDAVRERAEKTAEKIFGGYSYGR